MIAVVTINVIIHKLIATVTTTPVATYVAASYILTCFSCVIPAFLITILGLQEYSFRNTGYVKPHLLSSPEIYAAILLSVIYVSGTGSIVILNSNT